MTDEEPEVLTVDGWEEVYPGMFWSDEDKAHLRVKYGDDRYKVEVKPEDSDVWEEVDSADTMIDAYKKAEKYMKTHSPPKESKFVMEKNGRKYIWHPFEGRWMDMSLFEELHEAYKSGKVKNALDALEWFTKREKEVHSPLKGEEGKTRRLMEWSRMPKDVTEKFRGIHKELTDKLIDFFESSEGKRVVEKYEREHLDSLKRLVETEVEEYKKWYAIYKYLPEIRRDVNLQKRVFGKELSKDELAELEVLIGDSIKRKEESAELMQSDFVRYAPLKELGWEAHHHSLVPIALGIGILYFLKRYYE